jgi:ankyrin repeat protein
VFGRAGSTPLHFAASKNHVAMAGLLLRHGAQVNIKNECAFVRYMKIAE